MGHEICNLLSLSDSWDEVYDGAKQQPKEPVEKVVNDTATEAVV